MSAKEADIQKAVDRLRKRYTVKWSIENVLEELTGQPFDDMDDATLTEIANAAVSRLSSVPGRPVAAVPTASARSMQRGPARSSGVTPTAPFRFIVIPDEVVPRAFDGRHDLPLPGGFSARITAEWEAETALLVGEATGDVVTPLVLPTSANAFVIPGATWRGSVRSDVEIVAHGRIGEQANLHHRFGLRDFQHPVYADESPVSKVGLVKAGWLTGRPDDPESWAIASLGSNWAHVSVSSMLNARRHGFNTGDAREWVGLPLERKYAEIGSVRGSTYDFTTVADFSDARDVNGRRVVEPGGRRFGIYVFSDKVPDGGRKSYEYVFFDQAQVQSKKLKRSVVELFQRMYSKPSRNALQATGSYAKFKSTLAAGGRIPVFFVGDLESQAEGFAFGLTRLFKVPHKSDVRSILAQQPKHLATATTDAAGEKSYDADFVENLFGYAVEPNSIGLSQTHVRPDAVARKGRVAFSHASLVNPEDAEPLNRPISAVMMTPRASFAPFYLKSSQEIDYSAQNPAPKLAGRKRYLPRPDADARRCLARIKEMEQAQPASGEIRSTLSYLVAKLGKSLRFRSNVRMHNVSAAELGSILFALTHGGNPDRPCRRMIGRGKAFGAGQMRLSSLTLQVEPNDVSSDLVRHPAASEVMQTKGGSHYGFTPPPGEDARENASLSPFLEAFRSYMSAALGRDLLTTESVREFVGASDPSLTPDEASLKYMPLSNFKKVRDSVKPEKPRRGERPRAAAPLAKPGDGRTLPAPIASNAKFWSD